jgi:DNA repair exonuclease SbcCD ATPase subunit
MIHFEKLTMRNFMAFGETETSIDLTQPGTTLILGQNMDSSEGTISSNGAAKSTIMQAFLFAIFGKGIDKLKADEFINLTNGKKMVVSLEFTKGGKAYRIVRARKPNSLDLFIDGVSHTLDSMKNTDALIESVIGVPYDVYMLTFFLTAHNTSFLEMTGSEQRTIIESMLSLDTLVKRSESLKEIRKDLEVDVKLLERDYENFSAQNEKTEKNIERLRALYSQWTTEHDSKIESLKMDLDVAKSIDVKSIEDEFSSKVEACALFDEIKTEMSNLLIEKSSMEASSERLRNEYVNIKRDISSYKNAQESLDQYEEDRKTAISEISTDLDPNEIELSISELSATLGSQQVIAENAQKVEKISLEMERMTKQAEDLLSKMDVLKSGTCFECGQTHYDEEKVVSLQKKVDEIIDVCEEKQNEIERLEKENDEIGVYDVAELKRQLKDFEKLLAECKQNDFKIKHLMEAVNPHTLTISRFEDQGISLDGLNKRLSEVNKEGLSLKNEIEEISKSVETLKTSLDVLESRKFPLLEEYDIKSENDIKSLYKIVEEIESDLVEEQTKQNPYVDEVKVAESAMIDVTDVCQKIDDIKKDIQHVGYLVKLLTDNKSWVRKNIVDKFIPMLNKTIVECTEKLGLLHIPSINSDLSVDIEYLCKKVSYYNLSQGERLRTNLAVSLAFRKLMKSLGSETNLLMVDELFDSGGDSVFIQKAYYLLQNEADSVFMISHRDEYKDIVTRSITVVKENGFSRIESK